MRAGNREETKVAGVLGTEGSKNGTKVVVMEMDPENLMGKKASFCEELIVNSETKSSHVLYGHWEQVQKKSKLLGQQGTRSRRMRREI